MKQESQRLQQEIDAIEKNLASMPPGKLICARNGNRYKWYKSDGHKKIYIPKKNRKFAEQLAAKQYLSNLHEDLLHEKMAIDFYLRHHSSKVGKAEKLLLEETEVQRLLSPNFKLLTKELQEWSCAEYEHYERFPEQLIHYSVSGNRLRSKSEEMIDAQLYMNGIPFRYECTLQLGDFIIHPDFTIRHPQTGQIYYWEHFGLMDDPVYVRNVGLKLQQYMLNGIIPTIQLITTFESKNAPLGMAQVKKIVEDYFL